LFILDLISSPLTIFQPARLFSESPSINTPSYSASCSTPISDDYKCNSDSSISTQTERCLTKNTPRKMKLKGKLADTESKLKKTVRERDNLKVINYNLQQRLNATPTLSDFEEMCDKFFNIKSMSDFVKNQARLCSTSSKGRRYTEKDKQFTLMIHFYGPKIYRFLKKTWCLPSVRTLQRITEKWEIGVGISNFVLNVLSLKGQTMNVKGKECVLCADEMSLKSFLYYNYSKDEIIGLHEEETHKICDIAKTVLVLMIRGLHDSWKQPLGYFFVGTSYNSLSLKNIIFNCVSKLNSISFNVKVMISDMAANFKSFSDSVGVTPEHPYFNVGSQEVIYMFDPPHLLKSTRNNFFKYRFVSDDKIIESKHLKSFYEADNQRTHRLVPKLTDTHINPGPFQKMKVKYAAHIFSKTVTSGMSVCITDKSLPPESKDTILFIDSMDNLFDIFNSRPTSNSNESDIELEDEPTGLKRFCFPYDGSSYQNNFLLSMFNFFKNLKIQKYNVVRHQWVDVVKSYKIQFLKGWMVSIAGLIRLYTNLSLNYHDLKLFTRRLNQDCLENLFGTIRIQNGNCINPTTIQFQRSFKKLFCLSYFEYNDGANCIEDLDSVLTNMNNTPAEQLKIIFPEKKCVVQINKLSVDGRHYRSLALPERNAFIYICGYLISKCLKIHSCLEYARSTTELSSEHFFTYLKSHQQDSTSIFSSLMTPDSNFCQYVYELDQIFTNNFQHLLPLPKVGEKIKNLMSFVYFEHNCPQFPKDYLLNLFIRFRIYTTISRTNRSLKGPKPKNRKLQILCNL